MDASPVAKPGRLMGGNNVHDKNNSQVFLAGDQATVDYNPLKDKTQQQTTAQVQFWSDYMSQHDKHTQLLVCLT